MGALAETTPQTSPALLVQHALDELTAGNSLEYMRLQHSLRGTNPTALAPILTALTYFAIKLQHDSPDARPLNTLFLAALKIDLPTVAGHPDTVLATAHFLQNLISADVSFIGPVLRFVARAFLLPVDSRLNLIDSLNVVLNFLLDTHPRAATLLTDTLRAAYPHPIRPVEEHVPYMRAVLHLARRCGGATARALAAVVFERLAAVEALVPEELYDQGVLAPEAEKMDRLLMEVLRHFELGRGPDFPTVCFAPAYAAYEAFVVPCDARFTPYALLYAAEMGGSELVSEATERLRSGFFDPAISGRLREKFLQHSSGMVIRSRSVDDAAAQRWMAGIARWLNEYIDAAKRQGSEDEVDADVHHLFYAGCAAFMTTALRRHVGLDADVLAEMRVARIVACGMRPLAMVDSLLAKQFVDLAAEALHLDESDTTYRPNRTRFGRRNVFEYIVTVPDLNLPLAAETVDHVTRWDLPKRLKSEVGTPILSERGSPTKAR